MHIIQHIVWVVVHWHAYYTTHCMSCCSLTLYTHICHINIVHLSIYANCLISNDQSAISWLQLAITVVEGWSKYSWWVASSYSIICYINELLIRSWFIIFGMVCWCKFFILATSWPAVLGDEMTRATSWPVTLIGSWSKRRHARTATHISPKRRRIDYKNGDKPNRRQWQLNQIQYICYDKNTDVANIRIYKLVYADELMYTV